MFTQKNKNKLINIIRSLSFSILGVLICMSWNVAAFAAEAEHETPNPIVLSEYSWFLYLVNFIILVFVLKKILWKPVTNFLDDRTSNIESQITKADTALAEALELKQNYEDMMQKAKEERREILQDAKREAQRKYDSILTSAYKDAEAYRNKMQIEVQKEHDNMIAELRAEIADLAIAGATAIINKNMNEKSNNEYVSQILKKEGEKL